MAPIALFLLIAADPVDPVEALQVARAVIEHQEASLGSFDAEYSVDIVGRASQSPSEKPMRQVHHYREQRQGKRFRRHQDLALNLLQSDHVHKTLRTFDGEKYRGFDKDELRGAISSEGMEPTCLIQTIYFSTGTIGEALRTAGDSASGRWLDVDGRRLLSVGWDEADGAIRRTYDLDPSAGYQPRRFTFESEYPPGYVPDGRQGEKTSGIVRKFFQEGDVYLPARIEITMNVIDAKGGTWQRAQKNVDVVWHALNPDLDDETFRIEFPDGTRVKDKDRGIRYIVGQPGSEEPIDKPASMETVAAAAPPKAGPAYEFWADWRIWAASSVLCLVLVIWFKWRGMV